VGKSWIIPALKLKWDASGEKTIHDGALVLVGFMWSLSVLTRLFSLFSLWIDWLSSSAMFSKENKDFLESLPLNVHVQTLMQVQKKKLEKWIKVKRKENKWKYIIYTILTSPTTMPKTWHDQRVDVLS